MSESERAAGRVLAVFEDGISDEDIRTFVAATGFTLSDFLPNLRVGVITGITEGTEYEACAALEQSTFVVSAFPDNEIGLF